MQGGIEEQHFLYAFLIPGIYRSIFSGKMQTNGHLHTHTHTQRKCINVCVLCTYMYNLMYTLVLIYHGIRLPWLLFMKANESFSRERGSERNKESVIVSPTPFVHAPSPPPSPSLPPKGFTTTEKHWYTAAVAFSGPPRIYRPNHTKMRNNAQTGGSFVIFKKISEPCHAVYIYIYIEMSSSAAEHIRFEFVVHEPFLLCYHS